MLKEWSQYGQRVCIFVKFLQFLSYNYCNFLSKNLCDKVSKIGNLRWLLRRNFRWLHPGVLNFSSRHCFHEKFCKTPLKNLKTATIWQRIPPPPREPSRFFSLSLFSSPIQEDRFEPTNFNQGPRISFISILTFHEKVNRLKHLVIRFVQKLTV